ncbi:PAS and helix-turn-helix domain-containing protein [Pragia fontium]|uniref:PAS domain S-box-containing protein n=2 Tax=Pragia fontium TaxID=82985 RepID=A0AAJ4WBE5_9GAMM|nr:PAS and helix-turn-helix domain-containing protein [Pragia fontium]GKX61778.1 hypothetical protein SOASR032_03470 [Pragia fontium]SFC98939.1 PAS domain S-box-containing protein [Pragia fontium DSM 5563 = ATCC 49100]SUB82424.1 Nitrogen regulation protein C [Pragia fontium]VEJ55326.1 Nitrogen regulation protein C [Pragia fontium]
MLNKNFQPPLENNIHINNTSNNEQLLNVAFHFSPVGLLVVAKIRTISFYNKAFADMFGYESDELIDRSLDCLYPSLTEFEHTGNRAAAVMRETGLYSDERIMRHKTGRLFWCYASGQAIDKADPLQSATWVFQDISLRRPVSRELTVREREVAQFLVLGQSSKEIGRQLGISQRTVEAHKERLMQKLSAKSTGELVAKLIGRYL